MSKFKKPISLSIAESCQLGFCTVGKSSFFPFTIFNPNAKPLNYLFKFTEFIISPSKGVLMANSYSNFRIQFATMQATVIVGTVILEVQGEQQRVFKLSAIGKYPYISTNITSIDFGNVLVTNSINKQIILKNSSQVPAQFQIKQALMNQQFNDHFFSFTPQVGAIPPKASFAVKINFNPTFVDSTTINNFNLVCNSGNSVPLHLKGHSQRFNVYFSTNSINFGQIKLQNTSTKVLTITNDSELQTDFEFFTDANNIFLFNEVKGTLQRNTYKKIIIQFRPKNTINYYERVYCIIRNHVLLYVDLIGTCYDLIIRPVPLMQVHVDTFRKRVIEGRISAIELKYIENNILLKLAKRGLQQDRPSQQNFYQSNMQIRQHPYILQKQLFLQNQNNQLISITHDHLDFGYCDILTLSGQKQIQITNKLQCKLNLTWITQKRQNLNGQYMTVFQVFPQSAVLKPNIPTKFTVNFRPLKSNNYYFQHLQFFAVRQNSKISKKTLEEFQYRQLKAKPQSTLLRNVKLNQTIQSKVKEDIQSTEVLPPLSGVLRCVGHSFNASSLPFLPIMKMLPSKVTFKPCLKNQSVYDSVELVNQSDTPIYFKFAQDHNKVFKTFPKIGLIQPKGFAIIALQFTPKQHKLYKSSISVTLNDMPGTNTKLNLVGICTEPQLKLENDGKLFFAPTHTGVCTKKSFTIDNTSKTRVTYRINIPERYQNELSFDPCQKQIQANESFTLNAFFVPQLKKLYKINVPIQAIEDVVSHNLQIGYHNPGSGTSQNNSTINQSKKVFNLEVNGEGSDGSIIISHEQIDFKTVKITQQKKISFTLKNTSNCAFFIDLHFKNNRFTQGYIPPNDNQILSVFNLDFKQGTLPANSQLTIGMFFSPNEVFNYDLKLIVSARQKIPKNTTFKLKGNEPVSKCQMRILAQGNYPLMQIIDIRNDVLSVAALWQNFQISKINNELGCKLDNNEKRYLAVETLTFSQAKQLQSDLKHYDWNLGYVSTKNKAKPRKVIITVKNYGGTPLDYIFKFPSDNKVEEELWADPGQPTDEEAYEKAIIENNIFQIRPKVGRLQSNQVKDIELIYSPTSLQNIKLSGSSNEIHFLKVVFQIKNGKSLVFNLKGTTLGPNQGLLTVKKQFYNLPDTPIGLMQPFRFPIELNNVGSIKVNYKIEIVYQEGQFEDVFKIQNPNHFLIAGQNHYLYCLYKPLIKKKYKFKVFVHVFDFNKEIQVIQLKIEGQGINKIKQKPKNQIKKPIPGQRTTVSEIGSKVFFSIEEIDFQQMSANDIKYKMIILYNMSKQRSLTYDFPTQNANSINKQGLTCGDKFTIEPAQGNLQPDKFIELKITLIANNNPSFYEGQIPCHITWASNKYSTEDNEITQKDILMSAQKESLFLRIKKTSNLQFKAINNIPQPVVDPKKSLLDHIFQNIFTSSLNDSEIDNLLQKLEKQENPLLDMIDTNSPIGIGIEASKQQQIQIKKDYSNHEHLLMNQQFLQITEIIMQNTFFNIIQETTQKQNDFLRVGKKFIQANKL